MNKKAYTRSLENVIKQMLKPVRDIPFNLVIESATGFRVLPFNRRDKKDKNLLSNLKLVANMVGRAVNKRGILRARPNEVGNDVEPFVRAALNKIAYRNVYKTRAWKILSIENLPVDIKYEFNSDNRRLYDKKIILAEGKIV